MSTSVSRRAVYAARFLKPPGFFKRALMRDKPRTTTGAFENPVRKLVRLREKAREFEDIPPPRKVPVAAPPPGKQFLKPVEGVPKVSPDVLQARLDFLLSDKAIQQQVQAPLLPGQTPYTTELFVWERQMRDLRKIYRAQYLQKLAEVTETERVRELALYKQEQVERRERRLEKWQRKSIDMKRAALLLDRRRIEGKVNETIEMTRRSKLKIQKLKFLKLIQDKQTGEDISSARNVSVPFLTRQLGGAVDLPSHKNRRIHKVDNVYREILEKSYDLLPEHDDEFGRPDEDEAPLIDPSETGLTPQQRAELYYSGFSPDEKIELIEQKIHMLQERQIAEQTKGSVDPLTAQLMDLLAAAKAAHLEEEQVKKMTEATRHDRDDTE
jgi:hypothetical protein